MGAGLPFFSREEWGSVVKVNSGFCFGEFGLVFSYLFLEGWSCGYFSSSR